MAKRLQDKVAIVTGSGGSIGRAACLTFAREGAFVVGCDIDDVRAQETVDLVSSAVGRMISVHPCDLTDPQACSNVVDQAIGQAGRIDILYNNAAVAHFAWFEDMSFALFRQTMNEEVDLVFNFCKAVWPIFVGQKSGVIVNTASVSGMICYEVVPGLAHSTAKAGILGMTRHLAMEGAPHNIRVNAISPGLVETQQSAELLRDDSWAHKMRSKIMLGRIGRPEDVAAAAAFLASDEAAWITGANLPVDGGTTAW
jgi:NAD(P)-dependent dehydrogenase (short-subunit alcohol dehydrogenase family)